MSKKSSPKPVKKVKMLAWLTGGALMWYREDSVQPPPTWKRVPSEDREIEVEE